MHDGQDLFDLLDIADFRQPSIQYEFADDIVDGLYVFAIVRHGFQQVQVALDVLWHIVRVDDITEKRFPYQGQLLELILDQFLIEAVRDVPAFDWFQRMNQVFC